MINIILDLIESDLFIINYVNCLIRFMLTKVRETTVATRKFQKCAIYLDDLGNTYAVLGYIDSQTLQNADDGEPIFSYSYDSFILKNDKLLKIPGAGLFDVRPMDSNELCTYNWQNCETRTLLYQTQPKSFRSLLQHNRDWFADKWINIVEDKSFNAKLLTPRLILKISQNMKKLSVENLKWSEQNCNITDRKSKDQSKFVIKKSIRNDILFDVDETDYQNSFITSIYPLNQSQALLHLGDTQYGFRNNYSLLNYDIDYRQTIWKYTPSKFETIMHILQLLKNNKLFVNGCYSFEDHICRLKLFDLRVNGVVANLIQSDNNDLMQFQRTQSGGRSLVPNFQFLSLNNNEFQIVSLLSYSGCARSFPVIIDTRRPDKISIIKLQKHFTHLRGLKMHNEKLITIERQYHGFEFRNAQLKQYRLESL